MPATVVAASFKNRGEAGEIGVHIGKGIGERIADAGLRREVDDTGKAVLLEQARYAVAIGKVELHKAQAIGFCELRAAGFFQRRVVIGIHVVEADDIAAIAQQTLRNVKADKTGSSGHKNWVVSHPSCPASLDSPPKPPQINPFGLFARSRPLQDALPALSSFATTAVHMICVGNGS